MDAFKDIFFMLQGDLQSNGRGVNKMDMSNKIKRIPNEGIFMSVSKKAEKIATALYMVTDLISVEDPMRGKIRSVSLAILSDTRGLSYAVTGDLYFHIARIISKSWELVSLMEVSVVVGFISDMNYGVLKNALVDFIGDLRNRQRIEGFHTMRDLKIADGEAANFSLKSDFFKIEETAFIEERLPSVIKDKEINKGHNEHKMSFRPASKPVPNVDSGAMEDRKAKIIELIKEKKDISIKDIVSHFEGYSQKTLLRDLHAMVLAGIIKKPGEKRWSRYHL